ncbi:hypothetical protein D9615_009109 [Tricholomella constricta]|uniref:Mannosyltransferase n=1 Tax=Tricholomella constricta TaxID=117010 RepID=A0A8H5H0C9_9AGAR|nr:hypothetical protein D9615_009109 [Tricholomella constricta]
MSVALDCIIFATGWAHVLLAPYTKVEESFNLHATHDITMYGIGSSALGNYDHFTFPGAVPRTFIGSLLLSWISDPIIELAAWNGLITDKFDLQILVRLVLATLNALGLCLIRHSVSRRFGRLTGLLYTLLTVTQFHLPFWMGRTIPNMFALLPVNIAISLLIDRAPNKMKPSEKSVIVATALLTFTAVVFRAEVLLLLGPIVLQSILHGYITLSKVIKVGLISGLLSLALTVVVDSYFWNQSYLWPEFAGLYFNVYQGKSAEWGTSPRSAYWTSHLPKLLLTSLPMSLLGLLRDQRIRDLLFPFLIFVGLISCLGHKEWRFIIYVVPAFNVAAARGARWMVSLPKNKLAGQMMFLYVPVFLAINIAVTYMLTLASVNNYPGGQALALLHQLYPQQQHPLSARPHVHISNLAAQTGASLFLHLNAPPYPATLQPYLHKDLKAREAWWVYNKTESLTMGDLTANKRITHLIAEHRPTAEVARNWKVVASVEGFVKWHLDADIIRTRISDVTREGLGNVARLVKEEQLWILERK